MYTTDWTVGEKAYKLRLTAGSAAKLEEDLGQNPINVLVNIKDNELPKIGVIIKILHASITPLNHGVSLNDVYALYDEYIDDGHTIADIIPLIIDVFKVSGFVPAEQNDSEKN